MVKKEQLAFLFRTGLPILIGIALMVYVIVRAVVLPITHDESNTCLTYSTMSVHDIVTYARPIPNNHILNTLLIKFFTSIFGMHPLPARLPNILGFGLYFIAVFLITRKITIDPMVTFFGICVMVFNPYLIDFFSLARGYALSISLMMISLYFSLLFLQHLKNKHLAWSVIFGALAVYANFTTLNFYAALVGLLGIAAAQHSWLQRKTMQHFWKPIMIQWLILFAGSFVLAAASYIPISKMIATDQFVYWGTNGFYKDTVLTLLFSSQYGIEYFNLHETGFSYLIIGFVAVMLVCAIFEFFRNKLVLSNSIHAFFMFVFVGTVMVNILQFYLVHTPYLTFRTALFFYPILAVNFIFFAEWLRRKVPSSRFYFSLSLSLLSFIHFARAANFTSCREWWYDADTCKIISYLEQEHQKNNGIITLNSSWWFFPSLNFHIETENKNWIHLAPFHQDFIPEKDLSYNYYYATSDDTKLLAADYDTVLSLGWNSRFLMKRKQEIQN